MYAPRVIFSMLGALAVFAVATYWLSGSLAGTAIKTAICAVLLQAGYFGGVLYLVWKESRSRTIRPAIKREEAEKLPVTPFKGSEPFNR
ncbi:MULTISPECIES: exopolysaccharide production repressor protein [unclassified Rhizobium]|jgi:exopolysaccharide production repressor protein|uniref:exopolysaccharide production repressor protein n=1 Tax=unclassified Rhizobium TaxID=2613769 RepID=UPI001044A95A|nr:MULTISPECIES: exopolysaccharide production repressor protein [unclassified Rhizobium]MBB3398029.1 exopolysaccharide production repressor protein [Rhizobium sp. BK060]MBB4171026.1 exopolysaccharide production repressor protein [Rhizobium sp. BK538]MBZ9792285.1 exopolysaccharide production repressor protein [Rhizobium sp. 3T7]TCM70005.1 exopolysaccharide production repressor protein [Rhizobium sp. BK068]